MKPRVIKGRVRELGYTQQFMADSLGMNYNTYRAKENGKIRFSDVEKVKLAELLEWTPAQLNDYLYDGLLPIDST